MADELWVWRHPRPQHVEGRCIGRSDVPVDPRRARRLARRIQSVTRVNGLPKIIWTSPLQRCADVGRWLKRWGWTHRIDGRLSEMDFGVWDGQSWSAIARAEVEAWNADFAGYAPGGGESVRAMLTRVRAWQHNGIILMVGHAGWMRARRWSDASTNAPVTSTEFPSAPQYGALWKLGTAPQ